MRSSKSIRLLLVGLALTVITLSGAGAGEPKGLNDQALDELSNAGVDKYLGKFTPIMQFDVGDGWTKHTFDREDVFDPEYGEYVPNGPVCIAGADYSVFTRSGDPKKLLIMHQGGGACWQGFYECELSTESQEPPAPPLGIWDFDNKDNTLRKYSIVYMPYCDGSVFSGDNIVEDTDFPYGRFRFHRGLRNQSAGMDLARATFPDAEKVVVAGSSAGGVGASAFAPFLVRFLYGNSVKINVFNDAGPIVVNLGIGTPPGSGEFPFGCVDVSCLSVVFRAFDWNFAQFYPQSCIVDGRCNAFGQQTGLIAWRLDNDTNIREAFYETDSDETNRRYAQGDGTLMDPSSYRELFLREHDFLNAAHPDRYRRFVVARDYSHTALQFPLFYYQVANGVLLSDWTSDFLKKRRDWVDIVEE